MLRFSTITIGCKVNQYETQSVAALLRRFGLRDSSEPPVPLVPSNAEGSSAEGADLVIINTCCVTASAAAKSRRAIRRAVKNNPNADIIILGCYATAEGETLRQVATQTNATGLSRVKSRGKIHVLGHHDNIAEYLQQYLSSVSDPNREENHRTKPAELIRNEKCMRTSSYQRPAKGSRNSTLIKSTQTTPVKKKINLFSPLMSEANRAENSTIPVDSLHSATGVRLPPIETFAGHQRAFVKVQDGCDAFCTYCVIPQLRSCVWSRSMGEILDEAATLVANGHREIVLCGVFLGAYGQPTTVRRKWTKPSALPELLRRVAETPGLWRVRLSSLEPGDVTDELLEIFRDCPTVAPHLHLPLQSGSSRILKRMNRQYDSGQFLNAVRRVRETIDDAAITTDVVVGFPGETDEDFTATLDIARLAEFGKIHTFPFSPRPGTAAWNWRKESPSPAVTKSRCAKLAELERELAENFRRRFIGGTVEALVEQPNSKTPPGHARGLTDRYIEVTFPLNEDSRLGRSPQGVNSAKAHLATLIGKVVPLQITDLSETGLMGNLRI